MCEWVNRVAISLPSLSILEKGDTSKGAAEGKEAGEWPPSPLDSTLHRD